MGAWPGPRRVSKTCPSEFDSLALSLSRYETAKKRGAGIAGTPAYNPHNMPEGPINNEPTAQDPDLTRSLASFGPPQEVIEVETVYTDPILLGFAGIVTELSRNGDLFTLYQFAAGTGNRLLFIQSRDESKIRDLFRKEADEMRRFSRLYEFPPAKNQ